MAAELTQTYQPNPLLKAMYRRFFSKIQVDEAWVDRVRELSGQGPIVYVLRNLNFVDFIALDHFTKQFELPEVRFANDLGLWVLNPMGKGWLNAVLPNRQIPPEEELRHALSVGGSAALFLKRPPSVLDRASGARGGRGMREGDELLQTLIELQRSRLDTIQLVPQLFLWTKRPDTRGTRMLDVILGPREWASPVRTVAQFLSNYRHVELRVGEPVNLREFVESYRDAGDEELRSRLTFATLRKLERERRSVTGPASKSPERVRREIVQSPRFRSELRRLVRNGKTEEQLLESALEMLRAMQAMPDGAAMSLLEVALDKIFRRIYAGIDVDEEGIARLKAASKEQCLVLLPSHKSHIDYLILSYVFNDRNLPLPLIAAGDNLTFFPIGPIFRRAGAFFIRRSFRGDAVYPIVVSGYVRRLIREGYPLEMFLEGGRSRTGKLLPPKFGLLKMIVDAAAAVPQRKVAFVPVSIGYERVVDSYEVELKGGEKTKEDAAGLLGATDVLRSRYGRINLQFGRLLTLEQIREELQLAPAAHFAPAKQRAIVTRLGNRVMDEINRVTAVTPGALAALALLSYHRRGQPHEKLLLRCEKLLGTLRRLGARCSPALLTPSADGLRPEAIREATQMFADGEMVEVHFAAEVRSHRRSKPRAGLGAIYTIPDDKRHELDGSKNIIIHFFVERALVAMAVLIPPGPPITLDRARERVQFLSRLFKHEFRFRADADFDTIFDETLQAMIEDGDLERDGDALRLGTGRDDWTGHQWLMTYAALLRSFVESYRVCAHGLQRLLEGPVDRKKLLQQTLVTGRLMFLSGELERPEAVSKPPLQNALTSFQDLGYVRANGEELALTPHGLRENALSELESSIACYLERELPA